MSFFEDTSVNTGSAGALARSPGIYKILSRFALNAGEGARAPGSDVRSDPSI